MKITKFIVVAVCILALTACRDTKTTHDREEDHNRVENNNRTNQMENNRVTPKSQRATLERDMVRLYEHLDMTQDQIDSFETMEQEYRNQSYMDNTENESLNNRMRRQDHFLRNILTSDQYQRYEEWKRDHHISNTDTQNSQNQKP